MSEVSVKSIPERSVEEMGLCSEFSGVHMNGNRVFGIKANACLSTTVTLSSDSDVMAVPDSWNLAQACTVPVAYGTAYLALVVRARIKQNQLILVHSGDGYMGRAAIAVALFRQCIVYTTVPSDEAKQQLLSEFPELNANNVIDTSVELFKQVILDRTSGKGLDLVYDSTDDYNFNSGLFCVKPYGKYVLTGSATKVTGLIGNNVDIERVNLVTLFSDDRDIELRREVLALIEKGIADNVVKPLDCEIFDSDKAGQAFKALSTNDKQKIVVRIRDDEQTEDRMNREFLVNAIHKSYFAEDSSYVIIGGLGGFGLELAFWLVERGARNLVLTSRTGVKNNFQQYYIERMRQYGAQVLVSTLDAGHEDYCRELITEANHMAPVNGIFSLAMVLNDRLFINQTLESWDEAMQAKVPSITNLDTLSRKLCPHLQYFVAFSSKTSGRGSAGQTNYGYANSYMERVCEQRRESGLPALCVQWGAIGDVGVFADNFDSEEVHSRGIGGTVPQRIHSCLSLLNHFLRSEHTIVGSLLRHEYKTSAGPKTGEKGGIASMVCNILGIKDVAKVRPSVKLFSLGMDSLLIVEIKDSLLSQYNMNVSLEQLSKITLGELVNLCN